MAAITLVPDASVVAKWVLREADSPKALALLDIYLRDEAEMVVPSLLYSEVANALRFNKLVKPDEAEDFMRRLHGYDFEEVAPSPELSVAAIREARALGATVYDTTYLVVAKRTNGLMVTADRKFERKARTRHVASLDKAHEELSS